MGIIAAFHECPFIHLISRLERGKERGWIISIDVNHIVIAFWSRLKTWLAPFTQDVLRARARVKVSWRDINIVQHLRATCPNGIYVLPPSGVITVQSLDIERAPELICNRKNVGIADTSTWELRHWMAVISRSEISFQPLRLGSRS